MSAHAFPLRDAYIGLLKRALLGLTVAPVDLLVPVPRQRGIRGRVRHLLAGAGAVLASPVRFDLARNREGTDSVWDLPHWPMTMIGARRLDNVEACVRSVSDDGIPGDFIETGVWKGGTTIFMRGLLRAHGTTTARWSSRTRSKECRLRTRPTPTTAGSTPSMAGPCSGPGQRQGQL